MLDSQLMQASKQISTGFSEVTSGFGFVAELIVPQA